MTKLVKEKSPLLFSNGGKEYASILMSILLKNTSKSICMFCEGFKPDLITETDYWEALSEYLTHTERTLRVLVNSNAYVDKEPLKTLFAKQAERNNDDTIQIRLITEEGRKDIMGQFNGALNNFAVFDDDMYRLEYEPSEYKAFGSFNNPEDAKLLLELFNKVFEKSEQLNGAA
ncbi:hypothetical protein [Paramuribaculum intestinale]|uniref:hypothetical protein n=1 Tax=Paramuribaculum intestinale TaxID=2094151 RepID=UPI0025AA1EF6|nr:hypothetical protein [Paramuribaculum intestinale]